MNKRGKVYLVGGGPGAEGLITLRGIECLEQAEVLVYDRLVDEKILARVKPGCELIYVGKGAKEHAMEQEDINALLVAKGKEGKIVTRLKGGDPFVLGRGGEEADALVNDGIPFEIVPGITAAIAVPAYAGIPVTHRHVASSFAVITGHEDPTKESSSIAWDKLATGVDTLVFLMGRENLKAICGELIKYGRPPTTPVALIRWGTLPRQKTLVGTLSDIDQKAEKANFGPPVVAVIGEVVSLRDKLRWFDNRPLFGKRVLVTRSRSQASVLSRLLTQEGAEAVELPAITIESNPDLQALDKALSQLSVYDWVVFTSTNGVEAFFSRLFQIGKDARSLGKIRICAIGEATSVSLKKYGIVSDLIPGDFSSQGILESFRSIKVEGTSFLLPRADLAGQELATELVKMGARVEQVVTYKTVPARRSSADVNRIFKDGIDLITFTSSSTVKGLVNLLDGNKKILDGSFIACIGPVTAETAEKSGLKVDLVAKEHTIPGLVQALVDRYGGK
ncbi:MAG: uroporphyrinogen-III C-methyltransferase [Dehalococcoidia bacterium]|nr:uroporphyrinogen-III C-methyltransferase [Dehalococcoidia bacterium]MBF8303730.1 uroporphyrinogen-III C-methyltransferase [Dehalococcoidia bacterium]